MADLEYGSAVVDQKDTYSSTAYSNNIRCGVCGSPVRHVPVLYEHMNIDWRCAKCLRRDKPVLDEQSS
jgi:hypothetical protein